MDENRESSADARADVATDAPVGPPLRVGVIGAGAVGVSLLKALALRGAPVGMIPAAVASRSWASAEAAAAQVPGCVPLPTADAVVERCDLVFIATGDDAIAQVAARTAWRAEQGVIHLSGAQGVGPLSPAAARGATVAALHPLMTFPRALVEASAGQVVARLAGATWTLQCADDALAARLRALVAALGGHVIALGPEDRAPYHLSAALVSNFVVTLAASASELWSGWGVGREEALRALLPLLRAAVANLESTGLPGALTGPIARGDVGAVRIHLDWMRQASGQAGSAAASDVDLHALRDAYTALARLTIPLAVEKGGLGVEQAEALRRLLAEGEQGG